MQNTMRKTLAATLTLAAALLCGCGSGYRATSKAALFSRFEVAVSLPGACTNAPAARLSHGESRSHFAARADVGAPVVIVAEQLYISFWGGAAASNSVLSDLQIPLTGAP